MVMIRDGKIVSSEPDLLKSSGEIGSEELRQLKRIAEAASDYLMGKKYEEFAIENGGIDTLNDELQSAVNDYEGEISESEWI